MWASLRKDGTRLRQLVQGRLTSQQPDTTGGTRIQGLGTRGLRCRPLTPPTTYFLWKGGRSQITPSPTLPGRQRLEPVYPGSQIPSHQVRRNGGGGGGGVLTSSTFALGDWASSAVLTVPGHPIWGSGPRTVSCCPHCLLLSPGMGGPPYARAQGLSPRPTSVTHCLGTPLC